MRCVFKIKVMKTGLSIEPLHLSQHLTVPVKDAKINLMFSLTLGVMCSIIFSLLAQAHVYTCTVL